MSFQDLDDGSGAQLLSRSPGSRSPSLALDASQRSLAKLEDLAEQVKRGMAKLGTREDSTQLRKDLHNKIDMGKESAAMTARALQRLLEENDPSAKSKSRMLETMHQKLAKDFEKQLKTFDLLVTQVLEKESELQSRSELPLEEGGPMRRRQELEEQLLREAVVLNQEDLEMREQEFSHLQKSAHQLSEIYSQVAVLVESQGEDVRRIEDQVEQAERDTSGALTQLVKSSLYKRKVNPFAFWLMVFLFIGVIALVVIILVHKK